MSRRHTFLVAGTAAVIAASYLVTKELRQQEPAKPHTAEVRATDNTIGYQPSLPNTESDAADASINANSGTERAFIQPTSDDLGDSELVRLPREYEVVFGEPSPASPLSLIHARFMGEPRDEWLLYEE